MSLNWYEQLFSIKINHINIFHQINHIILNNKKKKSKDAWNIFLWANSRKANSIMAGRDFRKWNAHSCSKNTAPMHLCPCIKFFLLCGGAITEALNKYTRVLTPIFVEQNHRQNRIQIGIDLFRLSFITRQK